MIVYGILIYILGFIITAKVFAKFGKLMGIDYSGEKDYSNYDDWDNNTDAYTTFSIFWPIVFIIFLIVALWLVLTRITGFFIKKHDEKI